MSNKFILWSMLIIPWATLLFMNKNSIRRYMPMALFIIVTTSIIVDVGVSLKLWAVRENIYPLNELTTFTLGALPAITIWIYRYTYPRYLHVAAAEILMALLFAYGILPWLDRRGIFVWVNGTPGIAFLLTIVHWNVIYYYQVWQETNLAAAENEQFSSIMKPALSKPVLKKPD